MKAKTKTKLGQCITLLVVLIIESIGFNNEWKYCILKWLYPFLMNFFIVHLLAFKILSIVFLIVMIIIYWLRLKKDDEEPLFIVYLIKGFQVKGSDFIGILNVLFVLCSIAWIGVEFYTHTINGYLNAFIYAGFMLLYPLIVAYYFLPKHFSEDEYHPKVLIIAVSNLNQGAFEKGIEDMNTLFPDKWLQQTFKNTDGSLKMVSDKIKVPWGPWGVFDPVRKSIIVHHAQFHEIILIISSEVSKLIEEFKDEKLKPKVLVENFLNQYYPNHKTNVKIALNDISGNDLKKIKTGIENILHTLTSEGIDNKDILFNITSGTAVISGAMILNAIPYDRKAEYARQDTGIIEEIPLNIYDVKKLWHELLEKVG